VSLAQLAHDAGVLDPQGGHTLRLTSDTTTAPADATPAPADAMPVPSDTTTVPPR
jgi:hypothetical protein